MNGQIDIRIPTLHPLEIIYTKELTDRVSSRLRGLAVYWRPRPSGMRQYRYLNRFPSVDQCVTSFLHSLQDSLHGSKLN